MLASASVLLKLPAHLRRGLCNFNSSVTNLILLGCAAALLLLATFVSRTPRNPMAEEQGCRTGNCLLLPVALSKPLLRLQVSEKISSSQSKREPLYRRSLIRFVVLVRVILGKLLYFDPPTFAVSVRSA